MDERDEREDAPIGNRLNPDAEQGQFTPQSGQERDEQDESDEPSGSNQRRRPGARKARTVERREDIEPASMTAEMEPISEVIQEKRRVDATLARFSAVHDEMAAEEEHRKSRRKKLMPWLNTDDALDAALSAQAPTTAVKIPPKTVPKPKALKAEPTRMVSPVGDLREDARSAAEEPSNGFGEDSQPDFQDGYRDEAGEPDVHALPAEDEPRPTPLGGLQAKKLRVSKRTGLIVKIAACAAAVGVLALTGLEYGTKSNAQDQIQQVAALDENSPAIQNATKQAGDENFLLLGSSARAGQAANGLLTDTMMVAHIPADHSRVVVVSFPGTLAVTRPACQGWNNQSSQYTGAQIPAQDNVRLDTVYASGGPRCVTDAVQGLSGLRINHFVGMDFGGFTDMVNALQGVSICAKAPVVDGQLGTIIPTGGSPVTLTGQQALNYARASNVNGDTSGVYGKITRQQRLLAALLRKLMGQSLLADASKLNGLLTTFGKDTYGDNLAIGQLSTLAGSLQRINLNRVQFVTVPTTGTTDQSGNQALATDKTSALFNTIIGNSPLTADSGQSGSGSQSGNPPVDPGTVKIQVLNGGDNTNGSAKKTGDKLKGFGFQVVDTRPTSTVAATIIKYAPSEQDAARTLASSVPIATLEPDPNMDSGIDLILASNFDGNIVAPHALGAGQDTGALSGLSIVNAADTNCS